MMIEINSVCLEALQIMADDYNADTLKRWDSGEDMYLRTKEKPESIINFVVFSFFREHYPELYEKFRTTKFGKLGPLKPVEDIMKMTPEERNEFDLAVKESIILSREETKYITSKHYHN